MPQKNILLVEDEPLIADIVTDCLTEADLHVVAVETADEAVSLIDAGHSFDGLVTDVKLPGSLSGWDLARLVRARLPRLPVVYTTGHGERDWRYEGVPESELVAKPFCPSHLAQRVQALVQAPH